MTPKHKDILKLLKIIDIDRLSILLIEKFVEKAHVPKKLLDKVCDLLMSQENIDNLYNRLITVYDDIFTHKEIKYLLEFYNSSTGKKLINASNDLGERTAYLTREWALDIYDKSSLDILKAINDYALEDNRQSYSEDNETINEKNKMKVEKKLDFIQKYANKKGWDIHNLTDEQVAEIQQQNEWIKES